MNHPSDQPPRLPTTPQGILVNSEDTGGAFALIEYDIPPRTLVAPLHTHRHEDEYSYVLTGTIDAQIAERTLTAGPGQLVAKTRGTPHTLWNPMDTRARVLELIVPGGFERCLAELYKPAKRTVKDLDQLWTRYDIAMEPESAQGLMLGRGKVDAAVVHEAETRTIPQKLDSCEALERVMGPSAGAGRRGPGSRTRARGKR